MNHQEFIHSYKSGRIEAYVNQRAAMIFIDSPAVSKWYLPGRLLRMWIVILSIPAAIISLIWVKWWIGLVILIIACSLPTTIKRYSPRFVLENAIKDKDFFNLAMNQGVIRIAE